MRVFSSCLIQVRCLYYKKFDYKYSSNIYSNRYSPCYSLVVQLKKQGALGLKKFCHFKYRASVYLSSMLFPCSFIFLVFFNLSMTTVMQEHLLLVRYIHICKDIIYLIKFIESRECSHKFRECNALCVCVCSLRF